MVDGGKGFREVTYDNTSWERRREIHERKCMVAWKMTSTYTAVWTEPESASITVVD
jgi:hypothetical protein